MSIVRIAFATVFLLMIPFVAMRFTDEVVWSPFDFVGAGVLLFGTGLAYDLISKRGGTVPYRAAVGVALVSSLLLVWVNLAVGLIGSEDNPANIMYAGVLAVGFIGAILARLQPGGMTRVLFAMALAQALVPAIALTIWKPELDQGVANVLGVNALFVALFVGSALLFRLAAHHGPGRSAGNADGSGYLYFKP